MATSHLAHHLQVTIQAKVRIPLLCEISPFVFSKTNSHISIIICKEHATTCATHTPPLHAPKGSRRIKFTPSNNPTITHKVLNPNLYTNKPKLIKITMFTTYKNKTTKQNNQINISSNLLYKAQLHAQKGGGDQSITLKLYQIH